MSLEYLNIPETSPVDGKVPGISPEDAKKRNDEEQTNQRKRQLSNSLSMIAIGVPLYLYHWKTIKQENKS
jgi:hypothetical protein